jgi:hypothetical protein
MPLQGILCYVLSLSSVAFVAFPVYCTERAASRRNGAEYTFLKRTPCSSMVEEGVSGCFDSAPPSNAIGRFVVALRST